MDGWRAMLQAEVGETVLAFYNAKNESDKNIIGVATYNVTPNEAGLYFNKIQCFCFDEQRLQPREEVSLLCVSCVSASCCNAAPCYRP